MQHAKIAFVGAGNMASSIVGGLLDSGHAPETLRAADPYAPSRETLARATGIAVFENNSEAVAGADVVILAVKPQVMAQVLDNLASVLPEPRPVILSIAAGITEASMLNRLGDRTPVVRCMPNTPALLRCGASALHASEQVDGDQRQLCQYILSAVGEVRWVDKETQLDAITALSGSGPAYFFLLLEAMIDAAIEQGLDAETASRLAKQTALGAARMSLESDVDLIELRRRVTSPGGTTEAAINQFESDKLRELVKRAMSAAAHRAVEMAADMG